MNNIPLDARNTLLIETLIQIEEEVKKNDINIISISRYNLNCTNIFRKNYNFMYNEFDLNNILTIIHEKCKNNGIHFELNQKIKHLHKIVFFSDADSKIIEFNLTPFIDVCTDNSSRYITRIAPESVFSSKLFNDNKKSLEALLYVIHLFSQNKDILFDNELQCINSYKKLIGDNQDTITLLVYELLANLYSSKITLHNACLLCLKILSDNDIQPLKLKRNSGIFSSFVDFQLPQLKLSRVIPLIGPDGSGKGAVQKLAVKKSCSDFKPLRFKDLYKIPPFYSIRYHLCRNWRNLEGEEVDETMLHYIFWVSFIRLYIFLIRNRSRKILLTRYYFDYFAAPLRNFNPERIIKNITLYPLYLVITPVPKKIIFLGCNFATLVERKNELDTVAVKKMEELGYDFILKRRVEHAIFISTERPPEETSRILLSHIVS